MAKTNDMYISTFIDPEEPDSNFEFINNSSDYAKLFSNSTSDKSDDSTSNVSS